MQSCSSTLQLWPRPSCGLWRDRSSDYACLRARSCSQMVPVCMWHFVEMQCFNLPIFGQSLYSYKPMMIGNCMDSGLICDYLHDSSSASVTLKLLWQPTSNQAIHLVMGGTVSGLHITRLMQSDEEAQETHKHPLSFVVTQELSY